MPRQAETMSEYEIEYVKNLYLAEVESIDERVGYILKALKHTNLMDNTYIIFTSDHGEFLGEEGYIGHGGSFYEETVHIPLIFFGPGIKPGIKLNAYVSHIDLIPTIKDLLGLKYRAKTEGKSYSEIANYLNENRIPTRLKRNGDRCSWYPATVRNILKRPEVTFDETKEK